MLKRTLFAVLLAASPASATKTQFFVHGSKADFDGGKLDGLVSTNFGELRLARDLQQVLPDAGAYASIDAMAEGVDGTIYVGTAASGKLLAVRDGKASEVADFGEAASVSSLAMTPAGDLLIGVSGDAAALHVLRKGAPKPERLADVADAQYVWGIALAADGKIYLATGPEGHLVELTADGKNERVVYDSDEDNLRAIVILNEMIFVGTDPNGLILKIDRATGKAFVIYDAPETEVSALLVDTRGGQIYAATSQLVEAADATAADQPNGPSGRPRENNAVGHINIEPKDPPKAKPGENDPAADGGLDAKPTTPAAPQPAGDEATPATQPAKPDSPAGPRPPHATADDASGGEPAANGNAVYRIEPQGFVSEVFRDKTMIFGLARVDDQLYIATGPGGSLYQLDLGSEEHVALAKTRGQALTSVLATGDGRLFVGAGGSGGAALSSLSAKLAATGTFTSPVLDASQVSAFGKLQVRGTVPADSSMTIATRSSNVGDEESALWSDWSAAVPAARFTDLATPAARYAQYRVTLSGNGTATPTLDEVRLAYQQPNVAPRIDSVTVTTPATADDAAKSAEHAANPQRTIEWTSTEPNGDELQFTLYARSGPNAPWVALAKDLTEATYSWDTRRVADGRYEVKVEASDALANAAGMGKTASRVADPVLVDNTPPTIGDIRIERAQGKLNIHVRAADRASVVAGLEYAIDDDQHWQRAQPSDMLDDSPDEAYVIVLPDPGAATRVVSLRCRDENGNTAHESVTIRPDTK